MSLLRWPRRSLLYVKEVQTERQELAQMAEAQPAFYERRRRGYFHGHVYYEDLAC